MKKPSRTPPVAGRHAVARRRALRVVAIFEAAKGLAALIAMVGVLNLMHRDVRRLAIELIGRFGLQPDEHYPSLLLHYAGLLPGANLHAIVALAVAYIALRLAEAYGLWNDWSWAEWLGALSGGIYVPFELRHLLREPSLISGAVLAGNVLVVGLLACQLWLRRGR
jgi:uncharacterized membrane protein (DUF2068 family)